MQEIKSIKFHGCLGWLVLNNGEEIPLDQVTDNNIIDLCYNKKSKILKPLRDIMEGMYFLVSESPLYQHPLKGRASFGVYAIHLSTMKSAPKRYNELDGTYVLSYNDNRVMKVRN